MSDAEQNSTVKKPAKKGFMGLTMHMTAGRWLMMGVGGVSLLTAFGVIWLEGRNASVDSGANVNVQANSGMRNAPGKSSPAYAKEVIAYNKKQSAYALAHNESYVGVPVTGLTSMPVPQQPVSQPATIPSAQQSSIQAQQPQQPQSMPADSAISKEFNVIATAMENERTINPGYYIPHYQMLPSPVQVSETSGAASGSASTSSAKKPAIRPGSIIYGVFENAMKSTMPGPVIGELVQGKYNGDRVIGAFTSTSGTNHLLIRLHTLVLPSGKTVAIDGYAVSPQTTLPGMATNVNYHVMARTANFLGAAFLAGVEGYGAAVAQQGTTTMSSVFGGGMTAYPMLTPTQTLDVAAGQAAQQLQPIQQNMMQNVMEPDTVTVAQGTPFGLLVVSSGKAAVTAAAQATVPVQQQQPMRGYPVTGVYPTNERYPVTVGGRGPVQYMASPGMGAPYP